MTAIRVFLLCFTLSFTVRANEEHDLASKAKADQLERSRCGYNLMKLWTAEVAHSPFAATPLITDVDADGQLDIIAAPLSEAQTVLVAETGKTLPDSKWPAQKLDSSILASPLQYDINRDGVLDVLFITSLGDLLFYTANGTVMRDYSFEISPAYVKQNWHQEVVSAAGNNVKEYVSSSSQQGKEYLPVDAHVMATPVIADLNNDNKADELVVPVSYFFDEEDYRLPESFAHINNINETELEKYVVSGLTIIDLSSLKVIDTIFLDLTKKSSGFPGYVLFSPTVIDIDRRAGHLEIVIGTSAGNVHMIDTEHGMQDRMGFPYSMGSIHGQVTVADINGDGTLELIAIDNSGNVVCLNADGTVTWEVEISGSSSPGSRLIDLDGDGYLEVIIPTDAGDVYAISGQTGKVLEHWPIRTGHAITSNVIATEVSQTRNQLDLVFTSSDGALHVVSADLSCRTHFPLGETSLVQVLSHDLVSQSVGMELLISTNDGTLICMGTGEEILQDVFNDVIYKTTLAVSLPAETKTPNDFHFATQKTGIYVHKKSRIRGEATGSTFYITFDIIDPTFKPTAQRTSVYKLKVYYGSHLLHMSIYANPGEYTIEVSAYPRPGHGHVTLVLTNWNGQVFQDMFPIRFNQIILEDLEWLLMAPFVAMVIILLINHGFPAKDLLPITFQTKGR